MAENNLSYRIRTVVGTDNPDYVGNLNILLDQDYDTFEIMSLKIKSTDTYRLHNSNNGVIAGRVIANNGFGIPNAKISLFIEADTDDNEELKSLYPYTSVAKQNKDKIRYNLLPDNQVDECHQVVGTFPNKTYMLDNDVLLEIYDKYYKYTTRTNNSGDYMLIGVPTGTHTLHMDLDLSDCGILSQRPRDFVYKGYTIEQFENANKFKTGTNLDNLSQIFSQDLSVTVNPFWGNSDLGETVGITRADINVAFKFEPTCVFIGSVVSDNASNGISKKCVPTNQMGSMEDLTTGEGRIEMIRKTPGGDTEEFQIKGTQLIDGNGVWCYQIPMNLDYMRTDEYGNMVPTDDPEKGIATRTRVRFRMSMQESELNKDNFFRAKVLVPNNPQNTKTGHEDYDYNFGTKTREDSYRDLFWNNVYTVKSYIPRFSRSQRWKNERFTGIKHCNIAGNNNPIPYNNIRIKLPLMFTLICALIKCYVFMVGIMNYFISRIGNALADICNLDLLDLVLGPIIWIAPKKWRPKSGIRPFKPIFGKFVKNLKLITLKEGLCPDLDTWYFAPMKPLKGNYTVGDYDILQQTLDFIKKDYDDDGIEDTTANTQPDSKSIDYQNGEWFTDDGENNDEAERICLTKNTDYLIACIEMALAQEYKVINFDFYNDWINGLLYIPRWVREIKKKRKYWIFGKKVTKVKGCMNDASIFGRTRKYMQLCSLPYQTSDVNGRTIINQVKTESKSESQKFHKNKGKKRYKIFGRNGGIVHEATTIENQHVYYLKPCEWNGNGKYSKKVNLFATDVVLLGSLNNCDLNGVPQLFKYLPSSTYKMPTNLALTNMETEGPLYADSDSNTKCTETGIKEGIKDIDGDNMTLKAEIDFYNGVGKDDQASKDGSNYEKLEYDTNEASDTIPLTEAAGISWNYTGPGQGSSKDYKKTLYMPGGHFLGISCVNSQTNKKSCVNLERVCEIGASISQRHENVRKASANENGSNVEFKYVYNVPTGLIAEDEIIDSDARSMFATLNQRRLIATRTNPDTGYKYYDFVYRRPKSFGGEMNLFVDGDDEYNTKVDVKDEDLTAYNIDRGQNQLDYDEDETNYTQRRTIEDANLDYYMFRMGLEYEDLDDIRYQERKFLQTYYLPQYENSYYFYFGLKDGATALDEFNKQFFAACDSSSILNRAKDITVTFDKDICKGTGNITVHMENLDPEYHIYLRQIAGGNHTDSAITTDSEFTFKNIPFGTYKIEVIDSEESYVSKEVTIDANVSANVKIHHFNAYQRYVSDWYNGGYLEISDVTVDGYDYNDITSKIAVDGNEQVYNGEPLLFYAKKSGTYAVKIIYQCKDGGNEFEKELGNYEIFDTKSVHLYLGADNDINIVGGENGKDDEWINKWYNPEWWSNLNSALKSNHNTDNNKWALKHYLFAQDDVEHGTNSFDSNVKTDKSKALFGVPQNTTGFSGKIVTQGDTTGGYTLTDRSGYWQTLDNEGKKAEAYGAMVYNSTIVGGEYCGYISGGTEYWTSEGTNPASGMLIGVIAKSKIDDELVYAKVEGGRVKFNDEGYKSEDWTLFPLFRYPSIYRPFYGEFYFFSYSNKLLDNLSDLDANLDPTVVYTQDNGRLIGDIYNGITYVNKWGKMTICEEEAKPVTAVTSDDIVSIGLDKASFKEPQRQRVGVKEQESPWIIESGRTLYSYALKEGTPEDKTNKATEISDEISSEFLSNITYLQNGDAAKFFGIDSEGEETIDSDAIYYIVPKDLVNSCMEKSATTPVYYTGDGYYYVLGKYNEKAEFDQLGGTVIIKMTGMIAKFTKTGENGKVIEGLMVPSNPKILLSVKDKFKKLGVDLVPLITTDLKKIQEKLFEYVKDGDAIMQRNGAVIATIDGQKYHPFDPDSQTVIGVCHKKTGFRGRSGIVMLYPYIEPSSEHKLDGFEPYIIVTPNPLTVGKEGGPRTVTIKTNVNWKITSEIPDWVIIKENDTSGNAGTTGIEILVDDITYDGRRGEITFSRVMDDGTIDENVQDILLINQNAAPEPDPDPDPEPPETGTTKTFTLKNETNSDVILAVVSGKITTVPPKSSGNFNLGQKENVDFSLNNFTSTVYLYGVDTDGSQILLAEFSSKSDSYRLSYTDAINYTTFIGKSDKSGGEVVDKKTIYIKNNTSGILTITRQYGTGDGEVIQVESEAAEIAFVVYRNNNIIFKCNANYSGGGWNIYNANGNLEGHGSGDQGEIYQGKILIDNEKYSNLTFKDFGAK